MKESKKKKRAKIAKKHANILLPKIDARLANGDDLEEDVDNFEDSRIELRAAGHNLVRLPFTSASASFSLHLDISDCLHCYYYYYYYIF